MRRAWTKLSFGDKRAPKCNFGTRGKNRFRARRFGVRGLVRAVGGRQRAAAGGVDRGRARRASAVAPPRGQVRSRRKAQTSLRSPKQAVPAKAGVRRVIGPPDSLDGVRAGSARVAERFVTGENKACHPERSGGGKAGGNSAQDDTSFAARRRAALLPSVGRSSGECLRSTS